MHIAAGTWAAWNNYSTCSVTCGGGQKTRTRVCETSDCVGSSVQVTTCNSAACPPTGNAGIMEAGIIIVHKVKQVKCEHSRGNDPHIGLKMQKYHILGVCQCSINRL